MAPLTFLGDCIRSALSGSLQYRLTMGLLALLTVVGGWAYVHQIQHGLGVTGMSDQVSWGAYIANFTFLVGVAAASVMLIIPAYIFHRGHAKKVALLGEAMAVAACVMALLFVVADLGRPDRMLHMLMRLNFPASLLAWDVIVIAGYLVLNVTLPLYLLYRRYQGHEVSPRWLLPVIVLTIFWAIALHTVTAFLFSSNGGREFWHTALLGPRFLASAFASGPALLIISLWWIARVTRFQVPGPVVDMLAVIATVALQVNLVMLGAEAFQEFYAPMEHRLAAEYLFFGLGGASALTPWIWTALAMELCAVGVLMVTPLRKRTGPLLVACALVVFGVWVEKGMGLIVPGFVPSPLGEVFEYHPSAIELAVSTGIWGLGILLFVGFAKVIVAIELGDLSRAMLHPQSTEGGA